MQPLGMMPYYEEPKILAEIDLRGRFMMMACDIEWSMLNIMMYSAIDPNNHHRAGKFKGMMMAEKIQNTICDLKKYHPSYYKEYQGEVDLLLDFKEIRNDMGHYPIEFDDDSLQSFSMRYIGDKNGEETILKKHFNVQQIKDIVTKFRKANIRFMELVIKLQVDYNQKIAHNTL